VAILGRLYFRTSYGQNVLQHSIEMAHIPACWLKNLAQMSPSPKAGALVHDIGKALDHEVQGTHIEIGHAHFAKIRRRRKSNYRDEKPPRGLSL